MNQFKLSISMNQFKINFIVLVLNSKFDQNWVFWIDYFEWFESAQISQTDLLAN